MTIDTYIAIIGVLTVLAIPFALWVRASTQQDN